MKFLFSFRYAMKGLFSAFREQRNLKVQGGVAIVTTLAGFYFDITSNEWCIVLLTIGLVLGLEMLNTAIESLVDLTSPSFNVHAGKVKDIAAGAVLIASVMAVIVGFLVFWKYFQTLLS